MACWGQCGLREVLQTLPAARPCTAAGSHCASPHHQHPAERPLGTSRFKQYSGPGQQAKARGGKRARGGAGGGAVKARRGRNASPGARSDSEVGDASASDAELAHQLEVDEEQEESLARQRQRRHPAASTAATAAAEAEAAAAAAVVAALPRPEAAASAAPLAPPLAEDNVEAEVRRRTQLPTMPAHLSLFKAAPMGAAAAALQPSLLLPPVPQQQQGATLSTSSDASALSQPQLATLMVPGGAAASYFNAAVLSGIQAGLAQLPVPGVPAPSAMAAWAALAAQQPQWAPPALPPYDAAVLPQLPGAPLQ